MSKTEAAWSDFWKTESRGRGSGCLPNALHRLEDVQRSIWQAAVRPLAKRASVLDLATGDGAVLTKMRVVRPDLKLTGVDSAEALPKSPPGVVLKSGVRMEHLPFPHGRFDLVSSQFGIEYGDVEAAAAEVLRVLRQGGAFTFLVHHADGPIVAHNRARSAALAWAARESGLIAKAQAYVRTRSVARLPVPADITDVVRQAQHRFPQQGVAAEFAEAVRRTVTFSSGEPAARTLAVLDELAAKAGNELARVASLMAAARDPDGIADMTRLLRSAGLQVSEAEPVAEESGRPPFGWLLRGRR